MILFSDAVFAIAITLLIIEIKFPELPEDFKLHPDLSHLFKETLIQGAGFFISFFFIGMSWAKHLRTFRYLKAYDNGVIFLNLLSLLFIVAFPFSASGLVHVKPYFMFPLIIYLGNIMLVMVSSFLLTHYIFRKKSSLVIPGQDAEKNYLYQQTKYFALAVTVSFSIVLTTAILTNFNNDIITRSFNSIVILLAASRLYTKRFKPAKKTEA
jgi:uncharacterized membrane protein